MAIFPQHKRHTRSHAHIIFYSLIYFTQFTLLSTLSRANCTFSGIQCTVDSRENTSTAECAFKRVREDDHFKLYLSLHLLRESVSSEVPLIGGATVSKVASTATRSMRQVQADTKASEHDVAV